MQPQNWKKLFLKCLVAKNLLRIHKESARCRVGITQANGLPASGAAQSPSENSPWPLHAFLPCSVHQMLSRLWWGELLTHPRKCLQSEQPRCPSSQSYDHRCLPHAGPPRDRVEGLQVSLEPLGFLQDVRPPSLSWGGKQRTGWGPGRACHPQRAIGVGSKHIPYIRWCPTNHHCMDAGHSTGAGSPLLWQVKLWGGVNRFLYLFSNYK